MFKSIIGTSLIVRAAGIAGAQVKYELGAAFGSVARFDTMYH